MLGQKSYTTTSRSLMVLGLLVLVSIRSEGERLPIKTYTTADGLAHNSVNRIVRDSRGFLWFCTQEGLSRFDGYSFTNYGIEQGLPSAFINSLLETREGDYWVATAGGLCRFNPRGEPRPGISTPTNKRNSIDAMFTTYFPAEDARSKHILSLLQDREGNIWCGTRNGLYRVEAKDDEAKIRLVDLGIPDQFEFRYITSLLEDHRGALWAGSRDGLYRRWPDGRIEAYTARDGLPHQVVHSLLEDSERRVWAATGSGLCRLVPDPVPGRSLVARAYTDKDGLQTQWFPQLFKATDGSLWGGSDAGLIQFLRTADGRDFRFRQYAKAQGLGEGFVGSVAEDRNGNLWLANGESGVVKIGRSGFTTFGREDGVFSVTSICETRDGSLFVKGLTEGGVFANQFNGERFIPVSARIPESVTGNGYGWGWNQTALEDHLGEWWIATFGGLCRFPLVSKPGQLADTAPKAIYTTRDGLATDNILRLFEDSRGDIWVGMVGHGIRLNGLSRWERGVNLFHHYTNKDNLPRLDTFFVSSFAEDRSGNLWIGFSGDGGLVRYRDARFTLFTENDGIPAGQIHDLFIDSAGRLWGASIRGGLIRVDDPAAEHPQFVAYSIADGLSSNEIAAITEDQWGRIYIGTGRGVDRLDLQTGRIKHYTSSDGLPMGGMHGAFRDRKGALWFTFAAGVARLNPEPDPSAAPPPILITGLRVGGQSLQISALGEIEIAPLMLDPYNNQLQIDFVALGFSPGEGLRYQYQLEGGSGDWSQLADQRTINFASLAPGRYRFLVRAVNADGVMSQSPASVSFTIKPPIWRRWWFVTLAMALVGMTAYAVYRYRIVRLLELERVRTRIAADLHDDIGANLTKIGILSEVAQQQSNDGRNRQDGDPISSIARISRESVASMSDIVWAVNPRRDSLRDLTRRMREFAGEIFASRDIEFEFRAPPPDVTLRLGADVRRTVLLVFKEAVNNMVRHSGCDKAEIDLRIEGSLLVLTVSDNGVGFDASQEHDGNGLDSMRNRAALIRGNVYIVSSKASGASVTLSLPIRQSRSTPAVAGRRAPH